MSEVLKDLIGKRVEVWSQTGDYHYTDDGTLEAFEYPFIRLRTYGGDLLCFPVYNVRLVKLVE
jgi:hypothetical protein